MSPASRPSPALEVDDVRVPMRDGVRLAADVVRSSGGSRRPVLLMRTPYSRAGARLITDVVSLARGDWVVVVQDTRGRFDSEGDFRPFHSEVDDGFDTVQWCAEQPWCDGTVAMWGGSYVGATQLLAAVSAPPALRAISPLCTANRYTDGWFWEGGALQLGFAEPWAAGFLATAPRGPAALRRVAQQVVEDHDSAYRQPLGSERIRRLFQPFDGWLRPEDEAHWAPVDVEARHGEVAVPAFHVGGWYDIFCEGTLRNFSGLQRGAANERARRGQRLVVGPWSHFNIFQRSSPEIDFGPDAFGVAVSLEMMAWLGHAVRGEDVDGGARIFVMGANRWVDLPSWPPVAEPRRFFLTSGTGANSIRGDGRLVDTNPSIQGQDASLYDPGDPVPSRGGRSCGPHLPMPGPCDQRPVEERDDVLVYTSEVLDEALTVMGMVRAEIVVASTAPSADLTVKLVDVHPDGRAINIVDSVRRTALERGRATSVTLEVGSTAQLFAAGHRVRLEVSSSNFPRLDRNPSTGERSTTARTLRGARQTVLHGGSTPSWVDLPVRDAG